MSHRVAVTGVGAVCALGVGAETAFERLMRGDIAVRRTLPGAIELGVGVCALPELPVAHVAGSWKDQVSRTEALGLLALGEAHTQSGEARGSVGLIWGTTTGGLRETEACLANLGDDPSKEELAPLFAFPISGLTSRSASVIGSIDRCRTVCSACSSGALAIAMGAAWIRGGLCDRVYCGGADALCSTTLLGFGALGLLDPEGGRPFDGDRAGLSLGEGAGCLVLERGEVAEARGAEVLAWLDGWACGAEAFHITQPEPGGSTPTRLVLEALQQAQQSPDRIGYVNAHGTGTVRNDDAELEALEAVFGGGFASPRVSSNKAQVGHALGAAGALEAVFSVLALNTAGLPPNPRLEAPPHPGLLGIRGETLQVRAALSNSFGFGGMDATLCLVERDSVTPPTGPGPRPVFVTRSQVLAPGPEDEPRRLPERTQLLDSERSRRFDPLSVLVSACVERCLAGVELDAERRVGLFHGTAFGLVSRAQRFLERARKSGASRVPPLEFPVLLPSAASGNASIYAELHGPAAAVSRLVASGHAALHAALDCVSLSEAPHAVSVATEPLDEISQRAGELLFGIAPAVAWSAGAQLIQARPLDSSSVAVLDWGESAGQLPVTPGGITRAFLGGTDHSVEPEWGRWGVAKRATSGESVEGLGGLALERCLEELRLGNIDSGLVVDVVEGRCLFTLFAKVPPR
ncbi:MAG: beta-ketoacyl synthase N-terminal-like domain-containing protein [Polyangiaceae bacterium]